LVFREWKSGERERGKEMRVDFVR
jgi:hypothetical protein